MSLLRTRHRVEPLRPQDDPEENDDATRPVWGTPEIGLAAAVIQLALFDLTRPGLLYKDNEPKDHIARDAYRFLTDPNLESTLWWQWLGPHYPITRIRQTAEELWQQSPYREATP